MRWYLLTVRTESYERYMYHLLRALLVGDGTPASAIMSSNNQRERQRSELERAAGQEMMRKYGLQEDAVVHSFLHPPYWSLPCI